MGLMQKLDLTVTDYDAARDPVKLVRINQLPETGYIDWTQCSLTAKKMKKAGDSIHEAFLRTKREEKKRKSQDSRILKKRMKEEEEEEYYKNAASYTKDGITNHDAPASSNANGFATNSKIVKSEEISNAFENGDSLINIEKNAVKAEVNLESALPNDLTKSESVNEIKETVSKNISENVTDLIFSANQETNSKDVKTSDDTVPSYTCNGNSLLVPSSIDKNITQNS